MGESKREQFIRLSRSGNATRQDYIDLSGHGFRKKSTAVPVDPLKYFLLMSGAFGRDLKKHGGIASLAPRKRYAQGIGPVGEGKSFPTNSKMPMMDPYKLFFMYQNKLMRDKKKEGLAKILEV